MVTPFFLCVLPPSQKGYVSISSSLISSNSSKQTLLSTNLSIKASFDCYYACRVVYSKKVCGIFTELISYWIWSSTCTSHKWALKNKKVPYWHTALSADERGGGREFGKINCLDLNVTEWTCASTIRLLTISMPVMVIFIWYISSQELFPLRTTSSTF